MRAEDLILVSVDDHLVEPPGLFDGRLPAKHADRAPRVEHTEKGDDVWVFEGSVIPNIGLNAVAGRPKEEYGIEPTAFDEMRPGCWDIDERVKDMNAGGLLGSMCFPSFPGFSVKVSECTPFFARRRTSSAASWGSHSTGSPIGMKRPGYLPHHSSTCQSW